MYMHLDTTNQILLKQEAGTEPEEVCLVLADLLSCVRKCNREMETDDTEALNDAIVERVKAEQRAEEILKEHGMEIEDPREKKEEVDEPSLPLENSPEYYLDEGGDLE